MANNPGQRQDIELFGKPGQCRGAAIVESQVGDPGQFLTLAKVSVPQAIGKCEHRRLVDSLHCAQ